MGKTQTRLDMKTPGEVNPYNAQHIGRREEQQDYFAFSDIYDDDEVRRLGAVSVLADGMGGMQNGGLASKTAVDVFMEEYMGGGEVRGDVTERLVSCIHSANAAVSRIEGAGTTFCAAVIKDWCLYWASVGDSRIYLYRNGTIRQINKEHNFASVLNEMYRNGEISLQEKLNDPRAQMLTSYLGMDRLSRIDTTQGVFPLYLGDSVMICSDGLYRELSEEEMAYILANGGEDVCDELIEAALAKGDVNQDNVTVTLMDLD